jgi:DNA-binding MarR family transcriptional regulator
LTGAAALDYISDIEYFRLRRITMNIDEKVRELAGYFSDVKDRLYSAEKSNSAICDVLNIQEAHALLRIGAGGLITMSEIAKALHMALSSATSIVDKLESKKFVRRDRSIEDRRIVHVELTEEGGRFLEIVTAARLTMAGACLDALDAKEQDQLLELFRKIAVKFRSE